MEIDFLVENYVRVPWARTPAYTRHDAT